MRTARAKGLYEWAILVRHGLRNAVLPLITLAGLQLPTLFGGALVTETVFTGRGWGGSSSTRLATGTTRS
jgi:peptide/nickel transport system permease protein